MMGLGCRERDIDWVETVQSLQSKEAQGFTEARVYDYSVGCCGKNELQDGIYQLYSAVRRIT